MQCEGEQARELESALLHTLVGCELFDGDTPISPTFGITWRTHVKPFGLLPKIARAEGVNAQGFHIDPVITDLVVEADKLSGGAFGVDREATGRWRELAEDVFGDPRRRAWSWAASRERSPTRLCISGGMEALYLALYDRPDVVHQILDMVATVYEQYYDFLEREELLLPTNGFSPVAQESFAFTDELPADVVTRTTQCWGFLESQETTAVSPDIFGEFVFPYQQRRVDRFGLLSYGCCERAR